MSQLDIRARGRWDALFRRWSKPLSDTEEAKAENAARIIREAIRAYPPLAFRNVEVYATGSYRNNTNVRGESDIDVAAVCHDTFWYNNITGLDASQGLGITAASYGFDEFRRDVQAALRARFGSNMNAGDKAFNVHENTYRIEADVTPFFEYRLYTRSPIGAVTYAEGVQSISRSGISFINWHKDHYSQGVERNLATGKRFKRVARIFKNVKFDILENGALAARPIAEKIPSFLSECLVFNAQDWCFNREPDGYFDDVQSVLGNVLTRTGSSGDWYDMLEVSRRKELFGPQQPWSRDVVNAYLIRMWQHLFDE